MDRPRSRSEIIRRRHTLLRGSRSLCRLEIGPHATMQTKRFPGPRKRRQVWKASYGKVPPEEYEATRPPEKPPVVSEKTCERTTSYGSIATSNFTCTITQVAKTAASNSIKPSTNQPVKRFNTSNETTTTKSSAAIAQNGCRGSRHPRL